MLPIRRSFSPNDGTRPPQAAAETSKQGTTSAGSALQVPGLCVLDRSESLNQMDLTIPIQSSAVAMPLRMQNASSIEALPLGQRMGKLGKRKSLMQKLGKRKSPMQKQVEDARTVAKKAALLRAQQAGATGSFKSLDSEFNNFLIPVIPIHFLEKSKHNSNDHG